MKQRSFVDSDPPPAPYCWDEAEMKIVRLRRYSKVALVTLIALVAMALSACNAADATSLAAAGLFAGI